MAVAENRLHQIKLRWKARASVCVIAAAPGYPGPPTKGLPIKLPHAIRAETNIFHAGTVIQNDVGPRTVANLCGRLVVANPKRLIGLACDEVAVSAGARSAVHAGFLVESQSVIVTYQGHGFAAAFAVARIAGFLNLLLDVF